MMPRCISRHGICLTTLWCSVWAMNRDESGLCSPKSTPEELSSLSASSRKIRKVLQKYGLGFRSPAAQQRVSTVLSDPESSDAALSDTCELYATVFPGGDV